MAEAYENALHDISARIIARRAALDEERQVIILRRQQLMRLCERMQEKTSAFDAEDRAQVQAYIAQYDKQLQGLEARMQADEQRRREREEVFKHMLGAIQDRTLILEQDDDCLSAHPEMCQFFARKQISLQALLKGKMEELCKI
jgi:hypothetical protein